MNDFMEQPQVRLVVKLAVSFLFVFVAFNGTLNVESTVNADLGYWSVSTIYFGLCIGTFFSTSVVRRITPKYGLVLGAATYAGFMAANLYPEYVSPLYCAHV